MNLTKLYGMQKELDDRIEYDDYDRLQKKTVALVVEVSEWANEHRWFKFWSKDQEPRSAAKCKNCYGYGKGYFSGDKYTGSKEICVECSGTGRDESKNPLLEEYVDGTHFILSLGLEIEFNHEEWKLEAWKCNNLTEQFMKIIQSITDFWESPSEHSYLEIFQYYLGLGEMVGFTWEQIEQAYFDKNKVNHERQDNAY